MSRYRNVCFTVNNPDGQLDPDTDRWADDHFVSFCVWQLELSETGTLHFQGYLELTKQVSLASVKAIPGLERAHIEARRGNQAVAIAYCKKLDTRLDGPWEWGVPKAQGQRADLEAVRRDIDHGIYFLVKMSSACVRGCSFP